MPITLELGRCDQQGGADAVSNSTRLDSSRTDPECWRLRKKRSRSEVRGAVSVPDEILAAALRMHRASLDRGATQTGGRLRLGPPPLARTQSSLGRYDVRLTKFRAI